MKQDEKIRTKEEWAMKRTTLAVLAVFVTWSALDFVVHGLILGSTYAATQ